MTLPYDIFLPWSSSALPLAQEHRSRLPWTEASESVNQINPSSYELFLRQLYTMTDCRELDGSKAFSEPLVKGQEGSSSLSLLKTGAGAMEEPRFEFPGT